MIIIVMTIIINLPTISYPKVCEQDGSKTNDNNVTKSAFRKKTVSAGS